MQSALAHWEAMNGLRPRRPLVCIIDLLGLAVTSLLLVGHEPKLVVAVLPVAILIQYVTSCAYHWLPQNDLRQKVDQGMIVLLVAATYVPFWGTQLPASELLWRLPIVALLTIISLVLRCSFSSWWRLSAGMYPVLGGFGCIVSFNELQVWLPPLALAMFWVGVGCYFLQFIIWAKHRPNPVPNLFGYREVQHLILLCGTTLHTIVVLNFLAV